MTATLLSLASRLLLARPFKELGLIDQHTAANANDCAGLNQAIAGLGALVGNSRFGFENQAPHGGLSECGVIAAELWDGFKLICLHCCAHFLSALGCAGW